MAITLRIIKNGYGYKTGQVITAKDDFESGHLMGFGFAEPYSVPVVEKKIETQMVTPPETRVEPAVEKPSDAAGYFSKRVYRRKRK